MRRLIAFLCLPLSAAITNVRVTGVTATQAVVCYTAPSTAACSVEVSEESDYSPLVHDVNGTLFSGADSDSRTGSISVGQQRCFVVGKRAAEQASDGLYYSRALEANRLHYGRITCGGDQATFTFRTTTVRLGNVYQEATAADGSGGYAWPDINLASPGKLIDPLTGVAIYPVMKPRDYTQTVANQTISDCEGSGWTGVGPCQAVTDDSSYASTSGTNPLLVLMNLPNLSGNGDGSCGMISDAGQDALDYITVELNGYGAGATTAERTVNVCLTRDNGQTCGLTKQVVLPASDGNVTAGTANTVDLWESKPWPWSFREGGQGWIKTASSTPSTNITFTSSSDCARMRVGSKLWVYADGSTSQSLLTIQSLSCPDATVDTALNLYNGGLGVPFLTPTGISCCSCWAASPNRGFGFKIWKSNADGAAVSIDRVRVNLGMSATFKSSAGGFHNQCSVKDTANGGWYKCFDGSSGNPDGFLYGIREGADGEPEVRSLGGTYVSAGAVGCGYLSPATFGASARPWDSTDPNVLWVVCNDKVVKMTYTGNYAAKSQNSGVPDASFSFTDMMGGNSLKALIQAFATANNVRYDEFLGSGWRLDGVQGPYLILVNRLGSQDTGAWMAVVDSGNRLPIGSGWVGTGGGTNPLATDGTGFVVAMTSLFDRPTSSGCTLHTYEWVGHEPVVCPEWQNMQWNTYGAGPYRTTLKTAIPQCTKGTNCSNVTVTVDSTWDTTTWRTGSGTITSTGTTVTCSAGCRTNINIGSQIRAQSQTRTVVSTSGSSVVIDSAFSPDLNGAAWEYTFPTKPSWWHDGDPIGVYAPWALLQLNVDSHVQIGNERLRVVSRTENAGDLTIQFERGVWASNGTVLGPHSIDANITVTCNAAYAHYWYFTQDKTASGTTYYKPYDVLSNMHGTYGNGMRVQGSELVQIADITDVANWNKKTHQINRAAKFAGRQAPIAGNAYQTHPSNVHIAAGWPDNRTTFDQMPFQGTNLFSVQNNAATSRVPGFTHVYKYNYGQGRALYRKHFDTFGVAGGRVLKDISGPGSTITDNDRYKMCVADVAGECVAGSAAGDIYLNIPNLNQSYRYCAAGEVSALGADWDDACAGERSIFGHNASQIGVFDPPVDGFVKIDQTAKYSRALVTAWQPYRYTSIYQTFMPLPDARWAILGAFDRGLNRRGWWMAKIPPLALDSINRSTFVPVPVQLTPQAGLGVNNAIVEFGYNASFHCTSRSESCIANGTAVNETTPFTWPAEAGGESNITGVSCASGCTVVIPAISGRVLYYRWKYRNAAGTVLTTSGTQVMAVP